MKFRLIYLLFIGVLCSLVLLGNKNGRASAAKKGNTGAPGDEANANGSARICNYCHTGAAGAVVFINLLDNNGDTVSQYVPGQEYIARVAVDNINPALSGYGFQMIALRDTDNTDLDAFSDPGNITVNNYKLATINNGRTYAEHDNISDTTLFDVVWTAPPAGTGTVSFYAAGNAVNRNGTTTGDAADSDTLTIAESPPTAVFAPNGQGIRVGIWPNPVIAAAQIQLNLDRTGLFNMRMYDLNGQVIWVAKQNLSAGQNSVDLPSATWQPGQYILEVSDAVSRVTVKVLKI